MPRQYVVFDLRRLIFTLLGGRVKTTASTEDLNEQYMYDHLKFDAMIPALLLKKMGISGVFAYLLHTFCLPKFTAL
jgi:hypothetical protein